MKKERSGISLHDYAIPVDGPASSPLQDYSIEVGNGHFDEFGVYLRNQEQVLVQKIKGYQEGLIVGCVAWLTSLPILKALAQCKNVQILVQKEDFLRPDVGVAGTTGWKRELAAHYANVTCEMERHQFGDPMGNLSFASGTDVDGIRCVGNYNREKVPAMPRSHHKFLVFCRLLPGSDPLRYEAEAVWTGSFNFTRNAMMSFENAVFFKDKSGRNATILAFLNEHHQLFGLSEPLNWTED